MLTVVHACAALTKLHAAAPVSLQEQSLLHWLHPEDGRSLWRVAQQVMENFTNADNGDSPDSSDSDDNSLTMDVRMLLYRKCADFELDFEWIQCNLVLYPQRLGHGTDAEIHLDLRWTYSESSSATLREHKTLRGTPVDLQGEFRFSEECSDIDLLSEMRLLNYVSALPNPWWLCETARVAQQMEQDLRRSIGLTSCADGKPAPEPPSHFTRAVADRLGSRLHRLRLHWTQHQDGAMTLRRDVKLDMSALRHNRWQATSSDDACGETRAKKPKTCHADHQGGAGEEDQGAAPGGSHDRKDGVRDGWGPSSSQGMDKSTSLSQWTALAPLRYTSSVLCPRVSDRCALLQAGADPLQHVPFRRTLHAHTRTLHLIGLRAWAFACARKRAGIN